MGPRTALVTSAPGRFCQSTVKPVYHLGRHRESWHAAPGMGLSLSVGATLLAAAQVTSRVTPVHPALRKQTLGFEGWSLSRKSKQGTEGKVPPGVTAAAL